VNCEFFLGLPSPLSGNCKSYLFSKSEVQMAKEKRGYPALAKSRYPKAIWVEGEGKYALLAYCGEHTRLLFHFF
jgi:hypothetical protein